MAEVRLDGVTQALRHDRRRSRELVARRSATASSSCCSARPAPARRRRCASSPGWRGPMRAASSIGGRDVTGAPPAARDVTFVFQQYSLYPHLSVFDNLAFPLRSPARRVRRGRDRRARSREVARAAADRGQARQPGDAALRRPDAARRDRPRPGAPPAIYLMDEPLSSLDAKLRARAAPRAASASSSELGATILYVTHDQTEAMTMATRIGVIDRGRLVQVGTPREIYEDPVNVYVATRLGQPGINLVPRALFPSLPAPAAAATDRRAHRARAHRARRRTAAALGNVSTGSSIWAIRTICMSRSASASSSRWAIRTRAWQSATRSPSSVTRPLFFDAAADASAG